MATFTVPEIPQILTLKHWLTTKDIPDMLRERSMCEGTLGELAKAYKKARLETLPSFLKQAPAWAQYHYGRWSKLCDDLVREVIVGGVINLREAIGEARNAALQTEKNVDKKDALAPKSSALLRKMAQSADALLKDLRPDIIEAAIRDKEKEVNTAMLEIAAAPLDEIKRLVAKAKGAVALVVRTPTAAAYNKSIGSGADGLARELAGELLKLAALPPTKGIDYDNAADAARSAKELLGSAPLPPTADKDAVTAALKDFLQITAVAAKLPKLKL